MADVGRTMSHHWIDRLAERIGFVPSEKIVAAVREADEKAGNVLKEVEAKAAQSTQEAAAKVMALIASASSSGFGSSITSPDRTYSQLVDAYASWVYTAIDKIASTVPTLKLKLMVYRASGSRAKVILPHSLRAELKGLRTERARDMLVREKGLRKEEILDHPWIDLNQRPNPVSTRFTFWYDTLARLELLGSCGWYLPMNRLGLPGEVWPLPLTKSASLVPVVDGFARVQGWKYRDGQVNETIPPEELVFLRYPHPGSPFKGMSPLLAQTYPYDIDLYMMQRQKALFENQAIPGLNLHTDQQLQPDQAKELMDFLDMQFTGVKKSGKNLVTHSGLKANQLSVTNRDAMVGEVARQSREKILTGYSLSEGIIGLVRDVNRANMEGLTEMFVRGCLLPKTMLIEEHIETFLLPRYDEGLSCDFELPDLEDKEFERQAMETRLKGWVTVINEEREKLGKDPVPWGNRPWAASGVAPLGEGMTQPAKDRGKGHRGNGEWRDEDDKEEDTIGWSEPLTSEEGSGKPSSSDSRSGNGRTQLADERTSET